jgi:hypothetical protein
MNGRRRTLGSTVGIPALLGALVVVIELAKASV